MKKFQTFSGVAVPMADHNIDTDRIIPARFLKTIKRTGLGVNLFNDVRYNEDGSEKKDFILNQPQYRNSEILVTGDNFGCGSSREHAPWAITDFGIKCVISTSFADIFFNNSFKNGLLLIKVSAEQRDALLEDAAHGENARVGIDLENQKIARPDGEEIAFEVDPFRKHCLLEGLDDIGITLQSDDKISSFEENQRRSMPWMQGARV
ncbi:MAG: 3-isopropylmalate dehydratase small subunit [Alphaproteobacteria bacterium MarineAlpha11_Bin1]|nr:MAG: 3-isopropylmalate dehydratase small subunit [Alphaproteobacteria bacterium MarineAlpha11_Bin1]|tara:strand:+ start:3302 stop:3922 length:621 start_codon:yes stop_codon:yes gene_type:complete